MNDDEDAAAFELPGRRPDDELRAQLRPVPPMPAAATPVNLKRILPVLGTKLVDELTTEDCSAGRVLGRLSRAVR